MAAMVGKRWGHKRGEDGRCFARALDSVQTLGGVLEHPALSAAWPAFGINRPPRYGGWVKADAFGGWTCRVDQGRYGHLAKKGTWLYAAKCELPEMKWGSEDIVPADASVKRAKSGKRPCENLSRKQRITTPPEFRDVLLGMARSVNG